MAEPGGTEKRRDGVRVRRGLPRHNLRPARVGNGRCSQHLSRRGGGRGTRALLGNIASAAATCGFSPAPHAAALRA